MVNRLLTSITTTDSVGSLRPIIEWKDDLNRSLTVVNVKGGIATVNLSTEFDSGSGKESMQGRLAQVVYTITQFPTVRSVSFKLDGRPVTATFHRLAAAPSSIMRAARSYDRLLRMSVALRRICTRSRQCVPAQRPLAARAAVTASFACCASAF